MSIWDEYKIKLLVELLKGPGYSLRELIRRTSMNGRTLHSKIVELEKDEWISDTSIQGYPPRREIKLTEKGEKLAKALLKLSKEFEL